MLVKGPNSYTIDQIKDAIQDGLMAVTNVILTQAVIPGAGAFELTASRRLMSFAAKTEAGSKAKLGIEILAKALEALPKAIVQNAGFDSQDMILKNQALSNESNGDRLYYGINIANGDLFDPVKAGLYDNFAVKSNMIGAAVMVVKNFMSIDAVIKSAPEGMRK